MTDFPITPPPELVQQWWTEFERTEPDTDSLVFIATQAARWGADQELEACCDWLSSDITTAEAVKYLYADRRPKPPSLKAQALGLIDSNSSYLDDDAMSIIRRALEQLDD